MTTEKSASGESPTTRLVLAMAEGRVADVKDLLLERVDPVEPATEGPFAGRCAVEAAHLSGKVDEFWTVFQTFSQPVLPNHGNPPDAPVPAPPASRAATGVLAKSVVDEMLLHLARELCANVEVVGEVLKRVVPAETDDDWAYALTALDRIGGLLWTARAEEVLRDKVIQRFAQASLRSENGLEQRQSVDAEYHDEEGQEAIASGEVVCVSDSDVYVLSGERPRRLIHTHPEGTWNKAEDPASHLAAVITKIRGE